MPTTVKNRAANELIGQAEALEAQIADTAKPMSMEEVSKAAEGVRALRTRAAAIAEFTPKAEIERQGGDAGLPVPNPDATIDDFPSIKDEIAKYNKDFGRAFRSMRGFAHALGRNTLTTSQRDVLHRGQRILAQTRATDDVIIGDASDPSGGEFLLPLQQEPSIFRVENRLSGILAGARKYNAIGRSLRIPCVVQDSADGGITRPLAGIANITIVGEGDTKPQQDPKFQQRILTIFKAAAISQIGDETMSDDLTGGQLPATVIAQVGDQCVNFANELLTFTGGGTTEPEGALDPSNGALIVVNRETSQSITTTDIFNMMAKFIGGPDGIWLHSRSAIPQLFGLALSGNTLVTFLANLNDNPGGRMLMGYPLILCDILPQLGVQGDLALVSPSFYAAAIRQQLTVQSSIHVAFVNDITTWRFLFRFGGVPIPTDTYAYAGDGSGNKVNEFSPFVVLGDQAVS